MQTSIFISYYSDTPFHDRYVSEGSKDDITVIIPVIHVNHHWRTNLLSLYREVPIKQLIVGDGGCNTENFGVVHEFPRVKVVCQREIKTLGYSIKRLIELVEGEWFLYVHSDVFLPAGWYDEMVKYKGKFDWYGCKMRHTVEVEYEVDQSGRPYWGSQLGRRVAFENGLNLIEDDFVWRQEDIVWSEIVRQNGFKEGKVDTTFHYHQTIQKPSSVMDYNDMQVSITKPTSVDEELRIWVPQVKGIVKYTTPDSPYKKFLVYCLGFGILRAVALGEWSYRDAFKWIEQTNVDWLPHARAAVFRARFRNLLSGLIFNRFLKSIVRRFSP